VVYKHFVLFSDCKVKSLFLIPNSDFHFTTKYPFFRANEKGNLNYRLKKRLCYIEVRKANLAPFAKTLAFFAVKNKKYILPQSIPFSEQMRKKEFEL
jgi:hypothetical protein